MTHKEFLFLLRYQACDPELVPPKATVEELYRKAGSGNLIWALKELIYVLPREGGEARKQDDLLLGARVRSTAVRKAFPLSKVKKLIRRAKLSPGLKNLMNLRERAERKSKLRRHV
jgi:hypothetical protein